MSIYPLFTMGEDNKVPYFSGVVNEDGLVGDTDHISILTSLLEVLATTTNPKRPCSYQYGAFRFVINTEYGFVIKISRVPHHFDNIIEYKTYEGLLGLCSEHPGKRYKSNHVNLLDYFARPLNISSDGLVLLQESAIPVTDAASLISSFPDVNFPVPEIFLNKDFDFHFRNFGVIPPNEKCTHSRLVLIDYGMVDFQLHIGKDYKFVPFSKFIKGLMDKSHM